jgi:hypothetical protein
MATAAVDTPGILQAAGCNDLRLELVAVCAASPATADFIGISVHLSTKNLVERSILERVGAIKVPRRDAYGLSGI